MGIPKTIIRATLVTILVGLPLAASSMTASAAECIGVWLNDGSYSCVIPGQPADPPLPTAPVGVPAPTCDITTVPQVEAGAYLYCSGTTPCYNTFSGVLAPPPLATQPTPTTLWHVQMCYANGSWGGIQLWDTQAPPPSLAVQAREAIGQIKTPLWTLAFNPAKRTLVNLDTWFWAQGLTGQQVRGTSALGLVAVATPGHVQITPGDGSASFTCEWVTAKSDACHHTYRRSSVGGSVRGLDGEPAYQASGVATWSVRFELDGAPVTIAGAPTELTGPVMTTAVQVAEVQTIVTSVG